MEEYNGIRLRRLLVFKAEQCLWKKKIDPKKFDWQFIDLMHPVSSKYHDNMIFSKKLSYIREF